jgi:hypothetical protein
VGDLDKLGPAGYVNNKGNNRKVRQVSGDRMAC